MSWWRKLLRLPEKPKHEIVKQYRGFGAWSTGYPLGPLPPVVTYHRRKLMTEEDVHKLFPESKGRMEPVTFNEAYQVFGDMALNFDYWTRDLDTGSLVGHSKEWEEFQKKRGPVENFAFVVDKNGHLHKKD